MLGLEAGYATFDGTILRNIVAPAELETGFATFDGVFGSWDYYQFVMPHLMGHLQGTRSWLLLMGHLAAGYAMQ